MTLRAFLAAVALLLLPVTGWTQTVVYPDFGSTSGLTLRSVSVSGGAIKLADAANDRGSVFTSSTLNVTGFSAVFEFRISSPGAGRTGSTSRARMDSPS